MDDTRYRDCPGCGLRLPESDSPADVRFYASPECLGVYGELTGYTIMLRDETFIHQYLVDSYAAQHAEDHQPPIRVAFALIGLYFSLEKGYSGKQVQHMHMLLARRSKSWPRFPRPAQTGALTAHDMLNAQPGATRDAMLMRWSQSVWEAWSHEHERVKALIEQVMQK